MSTIRWLLNVLVGCFVFVFVCQAIADPRKRDSEGGVGGAETIWLVTKGGERGVNFATVFAGHRLKLRDPFCVVFAELNGRSCKKGLPAHVRITLPGPGFWGVSWMPGTTSAIKKAVRRQFGAQQVYVSKPRAPRKKQSLPIATIFPAPLQEQSGFVPNAGLPPLEKGNPQRN